MAIEPDAGALRHRLIIEEPVDAEDGAGGFTRTWRALGPVWARMEASTAGFGLIADRAGQEVRHRITIRWRDDLTVHHRVRAGTRFYIIRSIHDLTGEKRFLVLLTEEHRP